MEKYNIIILLNKLLKKGRKGGVFLNIVPLLLLLSSFFLFFVFQGFGFFIVIPIAAIGLIWGKFSKNQSEDVFIKIGIWGNTIWLIFLICWYSFIFYSWFQQP
jgi:predicted membrane protein